MTIEKARQAWRDSDYALALILRQRDEAMKRVEDEWEPLVSAAQDRVSAAWKKLEEAKSCRQGGEATQGGSMSREEMIRVFMSTPTAGLPVSLHNRIMDAVRVGVCGDQIETAIGEWIADYQITASIYAEALKRIKEAQ